MYSNSNREPMVGDLVELGDGARLFIRSISPISGSRALCWSRELYDRTIRVGRGVSLKLIRSADNEYNEAPNET